MQNKLQELTDRLYQEGLSKGKEEGEKLLFEAKAQADEIIAKAKAEAENIIEGANQQAADIKSKAQSDVKMASSQALQATKKALDKDVQAEFSKKISGGFTIGPKDGSYFISLTDQTFAELICEYLRPVTKKILFGE